ncbi:hypothetical protein M405DRAFT_923943 [Rhizopogon salebrosus TDB-379]|nr:hypothetical protein M405DRAFT_923943 [Rhizopogon salebrosus TDB-379]
MILAPYIQTTPVLEPFTRYTIPPVRCFSTIVSPPPITWASSFDVCVAAVLLIRYTAHPVAYVRTEVSGWTSPDKLSPKPKTHSRSPESFHVANIYSLGIRLS